MSDRRIYHPPWRVDLTIRDGVPRLLPATDLARLISTALGAANGQPDAGHRAGASDRGPIQAASLGLILSDDRELTDLNERHMGKRGPTDVLSFPLLPADAFPAHEDRAGVAASVGSLGAPRAAEPGFVLPPGARVHLGDVVVSVERAIQQAEGGRGGWTGDVRWSSADELRLLVVHGTLHVCGWDHAEPAERDAMRGLEARILGRDAPR